jgi:hypothetical protein
MAIRSATVSERTEPKLVLRKVPNTTKYRTSMNRARDNPAPSPLSLAKRASPARRAWEVEDGPESVEQAFQVCGAQVCVNPQRILDFIRIRRRQAAAVLPPILKPL